MIAFAHIVFQFLTDLLGLVALSIRPRRSLEAENLFLRRQLALYKERGIRPRRTDAATRMSLVFLSKLFDWRDALIIVRPETLIRWHRGGWRLLWRWRSRPGRPPIPPELRQLIRRMANDNALWGEERIANELLLKLGVWVSPRTVRVHAQANSGLPTWRSALVDISEKPREGGNRVRFLRGCHGDVSIAVRVRGDPSQLASTGALQCDRASNFGLDAAAVA